MKTLLRLTILILAIAGAAFAQRGKLSIITNDSNVPEAQSNAQPGVQTADKVQIGVIYINEDVDGVQFLFIYLDDPPTMFPAIKPGLMVDNVVTDINGVTRNARHDTGAFPLPLPTTLLCEGRNDSPFPGHFPGDPWTVVTVQIRLVPVPNSPFVPVLLADGTTMNVWSISTTGMVPLPGRQQLKITSAPFAGDGQQEPIYLYAAPVKK